MGHMNLQPASNTSPLQRGRGQYNDVVKYYRHFLIAITLHFGQHKHYKDISKNQNASHHCYSCFLSVDAKVQVCRCPARVLDNLTQTVYLQLRAFLPKHWLPLTSPERVKFVFLLMWFCFVFYLPLVDPTVRKPTFGGFICPVLLSWLSSFNLECYHYHLSF